MGIINDTELREMFRMECEEHLQKLEDGLLHLEQHPSDIWMLDELQRELHNVKGSSRMLGVSDVETVSHCMEDAIKAISRGEIVLTAERVDRLEWGLDALRKMANEAITGTPADVSAAEALTILSIESLVAATAPADAAAAALNVAMVSSPAVLDVIALPAAEEGATVAEAQLASDAQAAEDVPISADFQAAADTPQIVDSQPPISAASQATNALPHAADQQPSISSRMELEIHGPQLVVPPLPSVTPDKPTIQVHIHGHQTRSQAPAPIEPESTSYQIDTIRVEPKKLDVLMTRVGELVVTNTHIERWLNKVEDLIGIWEEVVREVKNGSNSDASSSYMQQMAAALYPLRQSAFEDSAALNRITEGLDSDIRSLRLLPVDRVFQLFPRTVRDLARALAKNVQLTTQGGDTTADKQLIEALKDPLMHLIRNAIHHGIETPEQRLERGKPATAGITLRAHRTAAYIVIEVQDDGKGLDVAAIKHTALERKLFTPEELAGMSQQRVQSLIFDAGFSTSNTVDDISGRGVGLDIVRASVERLKGTIAVESVANQGCKFLITLPLTLATTRVFLITVAERRYAIPVEFVRVVRYVALNEVFLVQDQETISLHGEAVAMAWMEDLLALPRKCLEYKKTDGTFRKQPCLILETNDERLGIFVDEIVEELEIVLKPAGPLLNRVRNVSGITILGSGEICVVLNPFDLMRTAQKRARGGAKSWKVASSQDSTGNQERQGRKPVVLLAEDSITTRTQERRILEAAGYEVVTAVDGLAAFNILNSRAFDALVSDIEMPQMDGLTLTSKVRENKTYEHLPIVLVTSLASEADRKHGMDVGADAYIAKSAFNQQVLLDTLGRLI